MPCDAFVGEANLPVLNCVDTVFGAPPLAGEVHRRPPPRRDTATAPCFPVAVRRADGTGRNLCRVDVVEPSKTVVTGVSSCELACQARGTVDAVVVACSLESGKREVLYGW